MRINVEKIEDAFVITLFNCFYFAFNSTGQ